jgi:hypothetical protein
MLLGAATGQPTQKNEPLISFSEMRFEMGELRNLPAVPDARRKQLADDFTRTIQTMLFRSALSGFASPVTERNTLN